VTIGDALATFRDGWVADQPLTPRVAYERTLRLLAFWLERQGRSPDDDLASLRAEGLEAFVRWHATSGLVDDAEGSRKVALHVARLGATLAEDCDRPDLAVSRDRLRALVHDAVAGG
jgi:hypothetical protein